MCFPDVDRRIYQLVDLRSLLPAPAVLKAQSGILTCQRKWRRTHTRLHLQQRAVMAPTVAAPASCLMLMTPAQLAPRCRRTPVPAATKTSRHSLCKKMLDRRCFDACRHLQAATAGPRENAWASPGCVFVSRADKPCRHHCKCDGSWEQACALGTTATGLSPWAAAARSTAGASGQRPLVAGPAAAPHTCARAASQLA